ncbi:hypothetical protein OUZ56_005894 [Daphnia magna]|uniref:Uncharacterized protein n=1 Tax=Daphnia magna TaxID=35525 RepID=A0ABQ9YU38_9CRUS|nr:hypothetical protein OUZ56_005894 [Daphnia magna]
MPFFNLSRTTAPKLDCFIALPCIVNRDGPVQINSCNILTTFLPVSGDFHGSSLDLESRLNHQYSPKVASRNLCTFV